MIPGWWSLPLAFLAVAVAGTPLRAEDINWQEAVTRLTLERTQAENCASALKRFGGLAAKDRGALAYDDARAEYNAIIAGLIVALARKEQPASLPDLQGRLKRGFEKREAFCQSARSVIPPDEGKKGGLGEIVSGAIGPLLDAVQAIYSKAKDDDLLTRKTIQTQLEAASWPAYASISPSL